MFYLSFYLDLGKQEKMNSNESSLETKGIKATLILEIIGRPPEHLVKALEELIKQIDEEKKVSVKRKKINEPILMKDSKDFYTTFAEVDIEVEDILNLAVVLFKYMPAHVEVVAPELIALTNNGWTDILSELTRRLHGYDEVARTIQIQNSQMQKKMQELLSKEKTPKKSAKKKKAKKK